MIFLSLVLSTLLAIDPLEPGDHTRHLEIDNHVRSYRVHVPPQYDRERPTPVVLIYHGSSMSARMMANLTALNDKADEAGFVAVYPNGTGATKVLLTFNAGGCSEGKRKRSPMTWASPCGCSMISKRSSMWTAYASSPRACRLEA